MPTGHEEEPDPFSAFVCVREERQGNLTIQHMELSPGHPGFDGPLYIALVPEPERDNDKRAA